MQINYPARQHELLQQTVDHHNTQIRRMSALQDLDACQYELWGSMICRRRQKKVVCPGLLQVPLCATLSVSAEYRQALPPLLYVVVFLAPKNAYLFASKNAYGIIFLQNRDKKSTPVTGYNITRRRTET